MENEDESPIGLLTLDGHLARRILNKVDYRSSINMEETCIEVKNMFERIRPEFPVLRLEIREKDDSTWLLKTEEDNDDGRPYRILDRMLPCKIVAKTVWLENNTPTKSAIDSIKKNGIIGNNLETNNNTIGDLIPLIAALKINKFTTRSSNVLPREIAALHVFKKLEEISIQKHNFTEQDIIGLKAKNMDIHCNTLSPRVINLLIRQWKAYGREITSVTIGRIPGDARENMAEIIEGLDGSLVFSREHFRHCLGRKSPRRLASFNPPTIYAVRRSENENPLHIVIKTSSIEIETVFRQNTILSLIRVGYDNYGRSKQGAPRKRQRGN